MSINRTRLNPLCQLVQALPIYNVTSLYLLEAPVGSPERSLRADIGLLFNMLSPQLVLCVLHGCTKINVGPPNFFVKPAFYCSAVVLMIERGGRDTCKRTLSIQLGVGGIGGSGHR